MQRIAVATKSLWQPLVVCLLLVCCSLYAGEVPTQLPSAHEKLPVPTLVEPTVVKPNPSQPAPPPMGAKSNADSENSQKPVQVAQQPAPAVPLQPPVPAPVVQPPVP
jgi:hypothetical protein